MNKLLTAFLLTAALAVGSTAALAQTCADIQGTGCAPSPLDGTSVNVTGTVYVEAGTYNSGSVYVQCSGSASGITFFEFGSTLAEGDVIDLSGTVGSFGDEIQLNSFSYNVVGTQAANPTDISTGALFAGGDFIGDFMRVTGVLSVVSTGFNSVYSIDDGSGPVIVFIDGTTGIDTTEYDAYLGDLVSIIGATKCFNGEGEILPRRQEDLQLVSIPIVEDSFGALKARF